MTEEEIPPGGTAVAGPRRDPWRPGSAAAGWLRQALARVHPGHAWISALGRP